MTEPTNIERLRAAVIAEGGDWTTARACNYLAGFSPKLSYRITPERARQMLNRFAADGLLVKHGARGRLWTPVDLDHDAIATDLAQVPREAWDAVYAVIRANPGTAERNAVIWRAVCAFATATREDHR